MAAGFNYKQAPTVNIRELARQELNKRGSSGVNLIDNADGYVLPLTPLKVDLEKLEAEICVRVRLTGTNTVKYLNGLKVGMFLGNGETAKQVTGIKEISGGYELEGVSGKAGDVMFEVESAEGKEPKTLPTHLNYATAPIKDNETLTILYGAEEIMEHKLFAPLTEADKEALGDRFYFIY